MVCVSVCYCGHIGPASRAISRCLEKGGAYFGTGGSAVSTGRKRPVMSYDSSLVMCIRRVFESGRRRPLLPTLHPPSYICARSVRTYAACWVPPKQFCPSFLYYNLQRSCRMFSGSCCSSDTPLSWGDRPAAIKTPRSALMSNSTQHIFRDTSQISFINIANDATKHLGCPVACQSTRQTMLCFQ